MTADFRHADHRGRCVIATTGYGEVAQPAKAQGRRIRFGDAACASSSVGGDVGAAVMVVVVVVGFADGGKVVLIVEMLRGFVLLVAEDEDEHVEESRRVGDRR